MGEAFTNAGTDLIQLLFHLYALLVMIRFILQATRADFYNPISQGVVRLTDPVLRPLRRIVPGFGGLDVAALVLCYVVVLTGIVLGAGLAGAGVNPTVAVLEAAFRMLSLVLDIYFWAFIIMVVVSWVAPGTYNPAVTLIHQMTEPVLAPIRQVIPPMGGLDFSVMVALFVIYALNAHFLPALFTSLARAVL